jgi:hypothetical protein
MLYLTRLAGDIGSVPCSGLQERTNMNKKLLFLLAILMSINLTGCSFGSSSSDDEIVVPSTNVQSPTGHFRFAHFSPDAGNLDIVVDGFLVATNLPYKSLSNYIGFSAGGTHRLEIFATGTSTNPLISEDFLVDRDTFNTIAALDVVANINTGNFPDTVNNGTTDALVRVLHASPDAGPLDLTTADGTVLVGNVTYPNATAYVSLPDGLYDLQLRVAGTNTVVRDYRGVDLVGGFNFTTAPVGLVSNQTLDLQVLFDEAFNGSRTLDLQETVTSVRVGHLSPGTPNIDVVVEGVSVAQNVPYANVGAYFTTPARDSAPVQVFQAGTTTELLSGTFDFPLNGDARTTLAAIGSTADVNQALVAYADALVTSGGSATNTSLRAIHAMPNQPNIDVNIVDPVQIIATNLPYPNASAYVEFAANNDATIDVDLNGGGNVTNLPFQNLSAGNVFTAFVIGRDLDVVNPPTVLLVTDI